MSRKTINPRLRTLFKNEYQFRGTYKGVEINLFRPNTQHDWQYWIYTKSDILLFFGFAEPHCKTVREAIVNTLKQTKFI